VLLSTSSLPLKYARRRKVKTLKTCFLKFTDRFMGCVEDYLPLKSGKSKGQPFFNTIPQ
jgi:hypothetical protein